MASFTTSIRINMLGQFNFSTLFDGVYYERTSSRFAVQYENGYTDELGGRGFSYGPGGLPTGRGIITDITAFDAAGVALVELGRLSVPVRQVLDAAYTPSRVDDTAIFTAALAGNDRIQGGDDDDVLVGFAGNDTIAGRGGNDVIYGEAGSDSIDGERGADVMIGGVGNDVYTVDHARDRTIEAAGQGTDIVHAAASYALRAGQSIEALLAREPSGDRAMNLAGNEFAQRITGNNAANVIAGKAGSDIVRGLGGDDVIAGGAGNDSLVGGSGRDTFIFDTPLSAGNVDLIGDFTVADDAFRLDNAVMPGLGSRVGALAPGAFFASATGFARDADDRIIYETDTGRLIYDGNGSAAGGRVQIALLDPNLALSSLDFFVV